MKRASSFKRYANAATYKIEAEEQDYLYIRESQVASAGDGLFTAIPIYKDEVISIFKGRILSAKDAYIRAANGEDAYFIDLPDGTVMDSMKVKCFAKYANDASGAVISRFRNNSKITLNEDGKVCIVANRKILAGEEIFCGYGTGYWINILKKTGSAVI